MLFTKGISKTHLGVDNLWEVSYGSHIKHMALSMYIGALRKTNYIYIYI